MLLRSYRIYCYLRLNEEEAKEKSCKQRLARFIKGNSLNVDMMVEEIVSGNILAANRKKFSELLEVMRENDVLIIARLMDLGRYFADTYETLMLLHKKGVKLCIINLPYFNNWQLVQDKKSYNIVFSLLQVLLKESVTLEKQNISIKTKIGMMNAVEKGKKPGHPKTLVPVTFKRNYQKYKSGTFGGMCLKDFCKMNGISKTCYYNWERKMKADGEI